MTAHVKDGKVYIPQPDGTVKEKPVVVRPLNQPDSPQPK